MVSERNQRIYRRRKNVLLKIDFFPSKIKDQRKTNVVPMMKVIVCLKLPKHLKKKR